jgi:uncharacterized membrane-anchored protein YhcB (DUF1043 family)
MKKLALVLTLVVGVGIGWAIARYQSHQYFQRLQQTWTPEFQKFVSESCALGKEMEETMTKEDLREYMNLVVETGNKVVTDLNSQTYGEAFQALLTKKLLQEGKVDEAILLCDKRLDRLVMKYENGDFEGDINEEIVGKLVTQIKSANQSTHSITASGGSE